MKIRGEDWATHTQQEGCPLARRSSKKGFPSFSGERKNSIFDAASCWEEGRLTRRFVMGILLLASVIQSSLSPLTPSSRSSVFFPFRLSASFSDSSASRSSRTSSSSSSSSSLLVEFLSAFTSFYSGNQIKQKLASSDESVDRKNELFSRLVEFLPSSLLSSAPDEITLTMYSMDPSKQVGLGRERGRDEEKCIHSISYVVLLSSFSLSCLFFPSHSRKG